MAVKPISLDGGSNFLKNFNREIGKIRKGAEKGLLNAMSAIDETVIPLTPIDDSPLRSSFYKDIIERKDRIVGEVGFTVSYAPFVHENLENAHPIGQAKFLETALKINQQRIVAEIDGAIDI